MYSSAEFMIPLAAGLMMFFVVERILSAILCLFWNTGSALKGAMSAQLLSVTVETVLSSITSAAYAVVGFTSALTTALIWVSFLLLMGSILYVTYEQAPWVWTDMARAYNAFMGPFIHSTVVQALRLFNEVFRGVIPLINAAIFIVGRILQGFIFPTLTTELLAVQQVGVSLYDLCRHLVLSVFAWLQTVVVNCPDTGGDACFDLTDRTLDLVTPMADVRNTVVALFGIAESVCSPFRPISDILTYPLMDLNLAKGVHNLINAVLYLLVQMPDVTYIRCKRHGSAGYLMCTPDLEPVFTFLVQGLRDLGRMIDNWLEVIFVVVQGVFGVSTSSCEAVQLVPPVLFPGTLRSSLFPNRTVIVGLGGWLMAITDGSTVVYYGEGRMRAAAWQSPIDISHGVAAVSYSPVTARDTTRLSAAVSSGGTALLGCACASDGRRMQVQCSILPYEGLTEGQASQIPVFFQGGIEGSLACADIDVVVQSVRWPATRFSSSPSALPECASTRTCNQVDATVWVIPKTKCDAESTVCSCYPFCMAARLSGTQASALVMYSAAQWRSKVYVVRRDCNLQSGSDALDTDLTVGRELGVEVVSSTQAIETGMSSTPQFVSGSTASCSDNLLVTSIINRTAHPAYTTPTAAYLRKADAPFVITGDTILTPIKHGDGSYSVRIERLTGFSGSEFTLSEVTDNFPAYPPVNVPADLFRTYPKDHVTMPYARQATLSVSSRNFVFYAVNPAMQVYDAYLSYCRNTGNAIDQFGIIMTSSFSPIRIWRVEAYRRCNAAGCGQDLVRQADIPDAFSNGTATDGTELTWDCIKTYNEGITQLEYINEANIAVTVKHTSVNGSILEYKTYWLHISTMRLRQEPWVDEAYETATALSAYTLCPSMQILPDLGSLSAEVLAAGLLLIKMPIDLVTYMPGITQLWSRGMICPLQARGHSVLEQCGSNAFLLDDFFNALESATHIFWSSLTLIALAVSSITPDNGASDFVQNFLNGLARYGEGSIDLWSLRYRVLDVMKTGPATVVQSLPTTAFASIESGKWTQGLYKVTGNGLAWARFGYTCVVKIVVTILQNTLQNKPVGADRAWRIVVNTLDEMRGVYGNTVEASVRQACAGMALMFGLTNPWSVLLYKQCLAFKTVLSSGVDLTLSIFNVAPLTQCMCGGSVGKVFGDYAMANCVPQASTSMRPILIQMIQSLRSATPVGSSAVPLSTTLCRNMLAFTKSSMVNSVQPWFDAQFESMDALGASLDFLLRWLDPKAGVCLNYDEDPDVVVVMPFPADYFQACASTSLCRAKCATVWNAFDQSLSASPVKHTVQRVTVSAESLFFPTITVEAFNPMHVHAVTQPTQAICDRVCGHAGDACLAVAGVLQGALAVQYHCVPRMMTSSVFRTVDRQLEWQAECAWRNDLVQLRFADRDGHFLVALTVSGDLHMLSSTGSSLLLASRVDLTQKLGLPVLTVLAVQVMHREPYASVHLNLLYKLVDGRITAQPIHARLVVNTAAFPDVPLVWMSAGVSFFAGLDGYVMSQVESTAFAGSPPTADFLLLPRAEGMPMSILTATWDADLITNGVVSSSLYTLPEIPAGLYQYLSTGQILSQNCVRDAEDAYVIYTAAPPRQSTAWLSQLRVSGSLAANYHSQKVPVAVRTLTQCGVKSCAGCPDGEVQRLCDAVQQCAVINCIGTPVNMRRVLCQMGQTIADNSRQNLAIMHGGWVMFVDIFMVIMDLSLQKGLTGVAMTWPDDSFFGYICTAKDMSAHYISIFTSAINSVLQVGHAAVTFLMGGAHNIDSNFHAMATMPLTALTSFMHQIFLMPLYVLIVMQKVMMCRVQGVLAIFDSTGFQITVGAADLQDASNSLVGHCLTANYETQGANPADSDNSGMVEAVVQSVAQSSALQAVSMLSFQSISLEPVVHAIDGLISYLMGIVLGLYDLVASLDMSHCKLPDYFLNETVFCACGDTAFSIPSARKNAGVGEGAFWCTGTVSLLDASNRPYIVYNPYTYGQLQDMAHQSDAYLACVSSQQYLSSGSCDALLPRAPALQAQGVSVLTVLTACKSNYMNKQWDKAAYVLFNQTVFEKQVAGADWPEDGWIDRLPARVKAARDCLLRLRESPACHADFIREEPSLYYSYQDTAATASEYVDSCQVFTGPADNLDIPPPTRSLFRACLDQYADSNCQLSSNLWTPQSDNVVPVAHMHAVRLDRTSAAKAAELKFQEALSLITESLGPLENYNNNDLATIFFSPEGDIMHQLMDCVFMGPYSKVPYWPQDSQGRLPVPEWFRDADGSSRAVNPRECVKSSADRSPPYSCGSATRQAVIKYFFRDYLPRQQNVTMTDIIASLVGDIRAAWSNLSTYACKCSDNRTHSLQCCDATNPSGWLPPSLDVQYQTVPPNIVLRTLTYQLKQFYRHALEEPLVWTKYLDAASLAAYDWESDAINAAIAKQEAHFRTDAPIVGYSETRSPFRTTALWQQCHGALSQVFFTIPMQKGEAQWLPKNMPSAIDGVDALDSYVRAAVREAFYHSPLFRHYNVSYVPSNSRLCRTPARTDAAASGRVGVGAYTVGAVGQTTTLLNATSDAFPVYGADAFPMHGCFCGWQGERGICFPPSGVCSSVSSLCPSYAAESESANSLLRAKYSPTWPCPAAALSDQWGILPTAEMDAWLTKAKENFTISGDALLRHGRSGLRVANLEALRQQAFVPVAERPFVEPWQASLPFCESSFASLPSSSDQFRAMIRRLFPVAQGVYESGATAYCLRYTIEAALLQALQAAFDYGQTSLGEALAAQRLVSDVWRRRCESQIALLALCKGLDVFKPPVKLSRRVHDCPFSITVAATSDVYMTSGCLVHSNGVFYDPCNCNQFVCGRSKPLYSVFTPACSIAFDPRSVVSESLRWEASSLQSLNQSAFVQQLLHAKDAVGNVHRGGSWSRDEGFLNVTGRHCDMLTDWWPQEETLPVGYHATTACSNDETGYRTFDSAFAVERTTAGTAPAQYTVVRLVYQNDMTRVGENIDTLAGGGGVCRASNLGLPWIKSNRVRVCTRQQVGNDTLDVAIPSSSPLFGHPLPENTPFKDEVCAEESADTAWFDLFGRQDSALHSVGTVPNMPSSPTATTYPVDNSHMFGIGPKEAVQQDYTSGMTGWGGGCSDFAVEECISSTCPSGYFCLQPANVCIHNDFKADEVRRCLRHDMCPPGLMCDGTGRCVHGSVVYHNTLDTPVEASVFSEQCDEVNSDAYHTDGASPWEYVPDWLEGHGMCSNKNWYMYSLGLQSLQACSAVCTSTACQLNARACELSLNRSLWWTRLKAEPSQFAVRPTVCDRDYEHLRGPNGIPMSGCRPKNTIVQNTVSDWDGVKSEIKYAALFRNYDEGSTRLALMPRISFKKTGFLGLDETTLQGGALVNCENFQNCYTYKFTYNGATRTRSFWQVGQTVDATYRDADTFRCGISAYYDASASRCKLDRRAAHLYEALCVDTALYQKCTCVNRPQDAIGCAATVNEAKRMEVCSYIQLEFTANYETIQAQTRYLQNLFGIFEQSDGSLTSQVSGTECFSAIYDSMQRTKYGSEAALGLYFPFTFALYEVPLAWVYQCTYLSGIGIDETSTKITCGNYENAKSMGELRQSSQFNFNLIRAGYTRRQVLERIAALEATITQSLPDVASLDEVKTRCTEMQLSDCSKISMVPYCATRLDWIPKSSMDDSTRKFLAAHYQLQCGSTLLEETLAAAKQTYTQYVMQRTVYRNYMADASVKGLRSIPALITEGLMSCVKESYHVYHMWPFSLSFPTDAESLSLCFRQSLPNVLNRLSNQLITGGFAYSDVNMAYMPSRDSNDQKYLEPKSPKQASYEACIFNDLNSQEQLISAQRSPNCNFVANSFTCNGVPCLTYPLTYMTGNQNCSYPLSTQYTSLSALLIRVWNAMSAAFLRSFAGTSTSLDMSGVQPQTLAFFPNGTLQQWVFDTSDVRTFMSNINPDTRKEVMCVLTTSPINFTKCNDDNFGVLKAFTDGMRQKGAPVVPPKKQLEWQVSREFLARGAVYAFAGTERADEKVLLRNMFDEGARCGAKEQMYNRVCLLRNTSARPWVPWMSGEWNPYEMCDVRRLDLDEGNQEEIWPFDMTACPKCSEQLGQYRTEYMYNSMACAAKSNTYSKHVNVEAAAPTNICRIRMRDTDRQCKHPHGMVGGGRGQAVLNHPVVSHLYGTNNVTGWPRQGGIYPRGDPVLKGEDSSESGYGVLSVPGDELGVWCVGMAVEAVPGVEMPFLRVARLPLGEEAGYMSGWKTEDTSNWTVGLEAAFLAEDAGHAKEQKERVNAAWDCPLRRAAYYSSSLPEENEFAPALPSPGRARRMFGGLTGGRSSHPTQRMQRDASGIGKYTTSNGFCFCPDSMQSAQRQCLVPLTDVTHPCSLAKTIRALRGEWTQSYVFTPQSPAGGDSPCQMQFDWPYVNGLLRDGAPIKGDYTWASNPTAEKCHVLDRLKPFQYRYKADRPATPVPGTSTTDQGGVCHTGRAATLTTQAQAKVVATRCVKASEDADAIQVSCEDGSKLTLAKEKSKPLDDMLQAVKEFRRSCSTCSPPPTFTNSRGVPIQAESSFGIPFRFSASRMLSEDLKAVLGNTSGLQLNATAWSEPNFMHSLLTMPESLFSLAAKVESPYTAPSSWPEGEWVFCNTTTSLLAGQCKGSIAESAWKRDRFQACYHTTRELTRYTPEVMSSVDVCLLDSRLQDLCVAVDKAQTLVRQANCLASGSETCALKPFLYQPSAWDVSNREFVHKTVSQFYSRVTAEACPDRSEVIRTNNLAAMNRCAATPFGALYYALQGCRNIVDALAKVLFYIISIVVNGLMLAFSAQKDFLTAQIIYYWDCIVMEMRSLVEILGNILFKMLFSMGSLGVQIYDFLMRLCELTNTAFNYWMDVWCTIAVDLLPAALGAVRSLVETCETAFTVLDDALDSIFMSLGPATLSKMMSKGYDISFRDKKSKLQAQERQAMSDNAKKSVKQGKKKKGSSGGFDATTGLAVAGLGTGSLVEVALYAGLENAIKDSPLGFVFEIASAISDTLEMQRLMSLYPQNWTLFSFDRMFVALDFLEAFVSSDDMCLAHRASNSTSIISCRFDDLTSAAALSGARLVATRCWADAQRSIGTSNLLACTESDTCYQSLYDRNTPVICGACPLADSGYSTYGCSPITKMCTCSVPTLVETACESNAECGYSTTTCQLVTGVDDMSYGNQPCTDCSKDVQCLVRGGSSIGKCACLFQAQPLQRCTQMPGQMVHLTDPNRMCGYLPNADRSVPLTTAQWDELSLVQCIYLNPAYVYCVQVYQRGTPAPLAVGLQMAPVSSAFQSRRLLSHGALPEEGEEVTETQTHSILMESWNITSEPCRSLVKGYQRGESITYGPTDKLHLKSCAYWRSVGRRTIELYNLTALQSRDTFLLSPEDFTEALMQRWVLVQLLHNPRAILFALGHWPVLRPFFAALAVVRAASMSWGMRGLAEMRYRDRRNESNSSSPPSPLPEEDADVDDLQENEEGESSGMEGEEESNNQTIGRKLLQTQTDIKFAETWLAGPFSWPPPFATRVRSAQCSAATALLQILYEVVTVLARYYNNAYTPAKRVSKRIVDNLPNLTCSTKLQPVPPAADSWIASTYHTIWSVSGVSPGYVREFFSDESTTNVFTITTTMLKCDFQSVTFCSAHRKDLFASVVILLTLFLIVGYFGQLMAVPYISTVLALSFMPLLLWYAYGMAFTCTPMLPTCFMADVVDLMETVFPLQVTFPKPLQTSPACLADSTQSSCLLRCSEPPMSFVDWRDTLAFAVCYSSQSLCTSLAEAIGGGDSLSSKLTARNAMLQDEALLSASLFCFGVTFVNVIPVLLLLVVAATMAAYAFYAPCVLLPKLFALMAQALTYLHTE